MRRSSLSISLICVENLVICRRSLSSSSLSLLSGGRFNVSFDTDFFCFVLLDKLWNSEIFRCFNHGHIVILMTLLFIRADKLFYCVNE
ncbi:hypothetical protein DERP_012816 [Dermatophagoides pteronyssinus]|uniref:Uncharacterized protein n=1 Tax=Dermatophagoides pteronyssinus TaxID=6956 RepID=A0ABQ8JF87_DERPT|nr:hypothetical protein DERP_012816 [Dermatophagoides pteronyssinus]